jgi:hypothetical protein
LNRLGWESGLGSVWSDRPLVFCIAVLVLARAAAFLLLLIHPLSNEVGKPVSPLHFQSGTDFPHYDQARELLFEGEVRTTLPDGRAIVHSEWSFFELLGAVTRKRNFNVGEIDVDDRRWVDPLIRYAVARPVMAVIIHVGQYKKGNTLPLAIVFSLVSCGWAAGWAIFMRRRRLPIPWILTFCALPLPVWFGLSISTDLVFSVIAGIFLFMVYRGSVLWALALVLLAMLLRPNGLSLGLFAAGYGLFFGWRMPQMRRVVLIVSCALLVLFALYLHRFSLLGFSQSWGIAGVLPTLPEGREIFGRTQDEYLRGIFSSLPRVLDLPLSWMSLLVAKSTYLVGARPSFGDTSAAFVVLRSASGLVLLPGLVYAIWKSEWPMKWFLVCLLGPTYLGVTQERYFLPVLPIVWYFGAQAYLDGWQQVMRHFASRRRAPDR